jgi:dTDP-4-amino-4,6-dideoxygalactose transaminase
MQCLSFGYTKPLQIGHGGAIILDDKQAYDKIIRMRYDGRDLNISPWQSQKEFIVGYHYKPSIEDAVQGLALLKGLKEFCPPPRPVDYPDLRTITIKE